MINLLLRRRLVSAVVAITVPIITTVAVMMILQADDTREVRRVVDLSHQRRAMLQVILLQHQDIETGQRGYLLSGDPSFLAERGIWESIFSALAGAENVPDRLFIDSTCTKFTGQPEAECHYS